MIKTLAAANRSERVRFFIPRSVQQSIPIQRIFRDGIWQSNGKFTQTWRFADINYSLASHDDQVEMFRSYCAVLNSLPTDATTKITINNRRLNGADFQRSILMREKGDGLDVYRKEYNAVLTEKSAASNNLVQDKYITVSVSRKNVEEARTFFHRVDADLSKNLGKLDSGAKALDSYERLRVFHDFFRPGEEQHFHFNMGEAMGKGHHFKDSIAPDGMRFRADHFEMGGKVGRVLFLREYASYIKDSMITDLSDFPRSLMLSIDILPIPTDEAVHEMQNRIMGIEGDITRWQQKQNTNNNFSAVIPYDLEQLRAESKEFLDDLSTRDQRMVFANVTLVHLADTVYLYCIRDTVMLASLLSVERTPQTNVPWISSMPSAMRKALVKVLPASISTEVNRSLPPSVISRPARQVTGEAPLFVTFRTMYFPCSGLK